jgi:hypothetical protein
MDANQTFKIGATTLTIAEAKVEEDATKFTVNLPRSLLTTIREIRFFDAKNAPIEGHRRGSYFNEEGQARARGEDEGQGVLDRVRVWQNLRTVKAPFKLGRASASRPGRAPQEATARRRRPTRAEERAGREEGRWAAARDHRR